MVETTGLIQTTLVPWENIISEEMNMTFPPEVTVFLLCKLTEPNLTLTFFLLLVATRATSTWPRMHAWPKMIFTYQVMANHFEAALLPL